MINQPQVHLKRKSNLNSKLKVVVSSVVGLEMASKTIILMMKITQIANLVN